MASRHASSRPRPRVDDALTAVGGVEHTVVVRRTGLDVAWYEGDRWLHDLLAPARMPPQAPIDPAAGATGRASAAADLAGQPARPAGHRRPRHRQPARRGDGRAPLRAQPRRRVLVRRRPRLDRRAGTRRARPARLGRHHGHVRRNPRRADPPPALGHHRAVRRRHAAHHAVRARPGARLARRRATRTARRTLHRVVAMAEPLPTRPARLDRRPGHRRPRTPSADAWGQIELGGIVAVDRPVDPGRLPDAGPAVVDATGRACPTARRASSSCAGRGPEHCDGGAGADDAYDHWGRRAGVYPPGTTPSGTEPHPTGAWSSSAASTRWSASPANWSR